MNDLNVSLFEHKLDLTKPLRTSRGAMFKRAVVYVKFERDGIEGYGEAAPLQGWGTESYAECLAALKDAVEAGTPPDLPAARFAWDSAMLDLEAREQDVSLATLIGGTQADVWVNATVGAIDGDALIEAAQQKVEEGFDTLKVKVGADDMETDFQRMCALRETFPELNLRFDANAAWEVENAVEFLIRVQSRFRSNKWLLPEYIEQPVPVGDEIAFRKLCLKKKMRMNIAIDESLIPMERGLGLIRYRAVDALVIKPMALGSVMNLSNLIDLADENNIEWVLTSSIDSAVARAVVAHIAAGLGCNRACGLATGSWLESDVGELPIVGGLLTLPAGAGIGIVPDLSDATPV